MAYTKFSNGVYGNIEELTNQNTYFRKVIDTTHYQQLVLMSIKPGVEIGKEVHPYNTQFIRIESGHCKAMIENKYFELHENDFMIVPPNKLHNVINISNKPLKLYTIYSPPHHPHDRIDIDKPIEL